jgi:hypothetical protein
MSGTTTWGAYFNPNSQLVVKGLYGSVVVKDYSPTNAFSTFSPFDPATGLLSADILGAQGFLDVGYLDENGVVFTPKYAVADTMAWQTRSTIRKDVTQDTEESSFTGIETTPLLDCLRNSIPLSQIGAIGASGYSFTKSRSPNVALRSLLHITVDNSTGADVYLAKLFPKAVLVKPDVSSWQAKAEIQTKLVFEPLFDSQAGFAVKEWRDGPGWRGLSGSPNAPTSVVATAVTGAKVNLAFGPATGGTAPYTYAVAVIGAGGTPTFTYAGTTSAPTAQVSGLTVGNSYTFTVTATDSASHVSLASSPSNSVTVIA